MTHSEVIAQFLLSAVQADSEEAIGEAVKTLPTDGINQIADIKPPILQGEGAKPPARRNTSCLHANCGIQGRRRKRKCVAPSLTAPLPKSKPLLSGLKRPAAKFCGIGEGHYSIITKKIQQTQEALRHPFLLSPYS
jgi:hypothetical protein